VNNQKGFSLLEIAIVLSIIGALIAIAAPRLFDKKSENRKVFREFILAGKDLKSRAKLSGLTYRLAFDLNEDQQSWWVEKSSKTVMLNKKQIEEAQENASRGLSDDPENKPPPDFQQDPTIFKKKQVLPSGYKFIQIESATVDIIYSQGMGYIHFFPQGIIESASIQIEDPKKNIWTIIYNPLTGQTDVIPEPKLLKDLNR
jgi:general secretion pathway protein H